MIKRFLNAPKSVRFSLYIAICIVIGMVSVHGSLPLIFLPLSLFAAIAICFYPENLANLSLHLFRAKKMDRVIAVCDHGLALMPENHWLLSNRAAALLSKGRATEARSDAEKALKIAPKLWQAWCNTSSASLQLQDYARTESDADRAIELAPNQGHPYLIRALARNARYDYHGCLEDCKHFEKDAKLEQYAWMLQISSHVMAADFHLAQLVADQIESKAPVGSYGSWGLTFLKLVHNHYADVLAACADVPENHANACVFMILQAFAYRSLNEGDMALQIGSRIVARNPLLGHGYEVRAFVLADAGHYDAALSESQRKEVVALGCRMRQAEAYVRWRRGEFAEMLECTEHAITIYPRSAYINALHGLALAGAGRMEEAEAVALKATKLHPGEAFAWYGLADLYLKKDQTDRAIESLDTGLKADPHLRICYQLRAEAQRRAGNEQAAEEDQQRYDQLQRQYMANLNPHSIEELVLLGS